MKTSTTQTENTSFEGQGSEGCSPFRAESLTFEIPALWTGCVSSCTMASVRWRRGADDQINRSRVRRKANLLRVLAGS